MVGTVEVTAALQLTAVSKRRDTSLDGLPASMPGLTVQCGLSLPRESGSGALGWCPGKTQLEQNRLPKYLPNCRELRAR